MSPGHLRAAPLVAEKTPAIAETGRWAVVDELYFHRHLEGNLERAIAGLEDMLKADPEDPGALWRLGRAWVRLGERRSERRKKLELFEKAEAAVRRSLEKEEPNAEAHFWLGVAMGRTGQTRGIWKSLFLVRPIKAEMRRVLELDPSHGGARHVLGEMLRQIPRFAGGSKKGAVRELETALEADPTYTAHHPALAQAYVEIGEVQKARDVLNKIFEVREPRDPGEYADNVREAREMLQRLEKSR